jgi:integrase
MDAKPTKRRGRGQAEHGSISTDRQFKALRPKAHEYSVGDAGAGTGGNLRVIVKPSGTKTWVYFYSFKGRQEKLTIGQLGLAEARAEVDKARILIREGTSPAHAKQALKTAMRGTESRRREARKERPSPALAPASPRAEGGPIDAFETVVALYLESYAQRRKRHWRESERLLRQKALAKLNGRRLSETPPADFDAVLAPLWREAPIGTARLHSELSSMCAWACGQKRPKRLKPGERQHIEPPAELVTTLGGRNPFAGVGKKGAESPPRERTLTDRELSLVWQASDALGFPYRDVVRLLILTGQRRGEVSGLNWGEIDLTAGVWNLPPARVKNKESHIVPLSPCAVRLLRTVPRFARTRGQVDHVFGLTPPTGFSDAKRALDEHVTQLNNGEPIQSWVFHDLRRTLVTGLAKLGIELHVIERIVNHTSGTFSGIVKVYQRHKFENEMRHALELWADHVTQIVSKDIETAPSEFAET